jgi:hypothetical protein
VLTLILLLSSMLLPVLCLAQELQPSQKPNLHFSRVAIGLKVSSLGAGIEMATRLTARSNLRSGFNILNYERPFDNDGITYTGKLHLRSAQVNYDWFPRGGAFHLSPGVLIYNGNKLNADLLVSNGKSFQLDHNTYRSDPKDPIRGNATITFEKVAPEFLVGWGNLIPRRPRHFSIPFEFGIVFHGQPNLTFDLQGKGCDSKGHHCTAIASNPTGQREIADEREKISREIAVFRFYPVISTGFAFNF